MDTKKMRWVSGNSVIEMSYIMPLFFSLFNYHSYDVLLS